jgi:hypothetical protein
LGLLRGAKGLVARGGIWVYGNPRGLKSVPAGLTRCTFSIPKVDRWAIFLYSNKLLTHRLVLSVKRIRFLIDHNHRFVQRPEFYVLLI